MANCEGDEWCDCVKWLKACGVLGVAFHATRAHDVAQALRDGVVLCHLTNVIKPGSLDKREFTQRPTMSQFLCLKNIKCFLKALRTHFSMRDSDLFDPNDLFELLDFKKVMKTLSKLSRTEAAQVIAEGFFVHTEDDDIYKNLADLDSEMPEDDIYGEIPAAQNDEKDEDIYEDLCALRTRRRENKSMRMSHQSSTESFSESGARESVIQKTKLDYCIEEILGTEKRYVEVLEMINEQFMEELQSILLDHMDVIFMNVAELYKVHKDLLRDLEKAQASDIYKIPAVFIAYKNKLVGYGDYCSGLITAQTTIDDLMSSSSIVRAGINSCQEKVNNGKFKLRDLLVVPMQRVLKYPLLLREMQKNSKQLEEGSEESKSLNLALEAMKDLSYFVNEVKRDKENLEKIAMVEASIEDLSMPQDTKLEDYGHLLRDGKLEIRSHDMGKESKRYVFLFDKVMLMCKTKGDTYSYKSAYVLHQFNLEECVPGLMHLKKRHAFMLAEKSKQNVITFYCPTDETKRKWMDSINLAMDNFSPPGAKQSGHDFIMQSFSRATECTFCKRLLTGSFYQGYLCSKTKKTAHKQCIQKIVSGERPNPPRQRALSHRETRPKLNYKSNRTYNGVPAPPNGHKALAFAAGLNIDVINQSDPHWWIGCIRGGEKGYFPSTSVSPANPRDTRVNSTHRASSSVAELSVRPTPRRPSRTIDEIVPTLPTQRQAPHLEYVNLQQLDDFPWDNSIPKYFPKTLCRTLLARGNTKTVSAPSSKNPQPSAYIQESTIPQQQRAATMQPTNRRRYRRASSVASTAVHTDDRSEADTAVSVKRKPITNVKRHLIEKDFISGMVLYQFALDRRGRMTELRPNLYKVSFYKKSRKAFLVDEETPLGCCGCFRTGKVRVTPLNDDSRESSCVSLASRKHSEDSNVEDRTFQARGESFWHLKAKEVKINDKVYVGTHDKASASRMLDQKDDGVFLIRESRDRPGEFALGVAYQGAGKHIKVLRSKKDDTYYLSDTKFFSSLPTLVSYYSLHSLVDSFPELPTNLQFAYKEDPGEANTYGYQNVTPPVARRVPHNGNLGGQRTSYHTDVMLVNSPPQPVPRRTSHLEFSTSANRRSAVAEIQSYARVTFDYSPTESNQIRLRQGEEVAIVSKAGGDRGWWKGGVVDPRDRSLGQLGYFPLTYVEEIC